MAAVPRRNHIRLGHLTQSLHVASLSPRQTGTARYKTLGYQDHYMVDGGRRRIIRHALAMPADVMENTPMLDLLWWSGDSVHTPSTATHGRTAEGSPRLLQRYW